MIGAPPPASATKEGSGRTMQCDNCGQCEECGTRIYQAGEWVESGAYLRVDDGSFQALQLASRGALPASFDGHVALYRAAAASCACERRHSDHNAIAAHQAATTAHATLDE